MSYYQTGFLGIMAIMLLVSVAALIFLSFDVPETGADEGETQDIYVAVHHIDTRTLETVDAGGVRRRWLLFDQED